MASLTDYDYKETVMKLHEIARELEKSKIHWVFGNDLRKFADRLNEVEKNRNIRLNTHEQFVFDYTRAINALPLEN